jgi:hypothetical protein
MTWEEQAAAHTGGDHILRFQDPARLRCHCGQTLLIPLRPELAPTPSPPKWQRPDPSRIASPETVARAKARAAADMAHRRQIREQQTEGGS